MKRRCSDWDIVINFKSGDEVRCSEFLQKLNINLTTEASYHHEKSCRNQLNFTWVIFLF
jgi:hypothetical protein